MNAPAIALWICVGLAAASASPGSAQSAPAQSKSSASASSKVGGTGKPPLSEIRTLVHKLQGHTDKLSELMTQYHSLVEQRPQNASEEQLAKWNAALERLLLRIDEARAPVAEGKQQLDQLATGQLPTALGKDVANAQNEADAQRTAADQALAKRKPAARAKATKKEPTKNEPTKKAKTSEPTESSELDDL